MKFIWLTTYAGNEEISVLINTQQIKYIKPQYIRERGKTMIALEGDDYLQVKEPIGELFDILNEIRAPKSK